MIKTETIGDRQALIDSNIPFLKIFKRGKVREVYEIGEHLLIIATDKISAFDKVMFSAVPKKGVYLTQQSGFWFKYLEENNYPTHFISDDLQDIAEITGENRLLDLDWLEGRVMLCKKTEVLPIEAICRFRVYGSAISALKNNTWIWDDVEVEGEIEAGALIKNGPAFTPTEKSETDDKITFAEMSREIGNENALHIKEKTIEIFKMCNEFAKKEFGFEIADGKVEWGIYNGELILIDETFTSDSARFTPDKSKEFFRQWLIDNNLKGQSVKLPDTIVMEISDLYKEQCENMNVI